MRLALAALIAAGLALSACGSTPKVKPTARASAHRKPAPAPHNAKPVRPVETARPANPYSPPAQEVERRGPAKALSRLPGWDQEDHRAALQAVQAGCGVARDTLSRAACAKARALGDVDAARAKTFLEATFEAEAVGGEGVLTAYFAPKYDARSRPDAEFSAPVRPRPNGLVAAGPKPLQVKRRYKELGPKSEPDVDLDDLIDVALQAGREEIEQEDGDGGEFDYPAYAPRSKIDLARADRATIERADPDGALAWMRPEDLFYLQIQGSGVLAFPDGRRMKATYAADNGHPFVAIARPMVGQGLLRANGASGDAIRGWLAANRGARADKVMQLNPRYIFFDLKSDDGREPAGAAGVPLPAGHAIAIDPSRHSYGEVYWIDAEAPVLAGSHKTYRRLVMALDTGSAIRGQVRADLYIGSGDVAGSEAGRVRHTLRMMRLRPIDPARSARHEADDPARGG